MFSNIIIILFTLLVSGNYIIKQKYLYFFSLTSIASILIIIILLIFFFQNKKIKNQFVLLISSTYFAFFLINIFTKILFFETQFESIQKFKTKNINLRPAVFPALFYNSEDMMILSGLSNQMTIYCKEDDYWSIYMSDRYGFNNNDNVYEKKNKILLLGDSFTHGACVNEGNDIAGHLRKKGINAINLGMGGNSELTKLATFREYGQFFEPKKIFWMYTIGDLGGFLNDIKSKKFSKYFYDDSFTQNLINRDEEKNLVIDKFLLPIESLEARDSYIGIFTLYDLRKFLKLKIIPKFKLIKKFNFSKNIEQPSGVIQRFDILDKYKEIYSQKNLDLLLKNLLKVKRFCEENKCEFSFVFLPSRKDLLNNKISFPYKEDLFNILKENEIRIIDTEPDFLNLNINDYMIGHYNSKGYEIVANKIAKNINF